MEKDRVEKNRGRSSHNRKRNPNDHFTQQLQGVHTQDDLINVLRTDFNRAYAETSNTFRRKLNLLRKLNRKSKKQRRDIK
jgi:hypothetical protein